MIITEEQSLKDNINRLIEQSAGEMTIVSVIGILELIKAELVLFLASNQENVSEDE